jgi:glyoxylase-like metal-dependent hydrolase (beta-lactamase superfamily II)
LARDSEDNCRGSPGVIQGHKQDVQREINNCKHQKEVKPKFAEELWGVMKLADGVEVLELPFKNPMGMQGIVNLTLIWDKDTVVLADTGFPGQLPQIREAMDQAGVPFDRLGKVIITHQDIDHIGCLPDILKESAHKVEVLAHEIEKPYIEGSKPLIKMNPERLAKMFASLPAEQRKKMETAFANPPKAGVDATVADGEVLPYCGGITVVFTPGHTPGHICLYLNQSKILVTGDALVAADGELLGPNPQATSDLDLALKSLKKLTQYDIETVVCYHGGVYKNNANQRLAELANG